MLQPAETQELPKSVRESAIRTRIEPLDRTSDELLVRNCGTRGDREAALAEVRERTTTRLRETGRGLELSESDLSNLDLRGFDLRGATLNRARLHGTKLDGADLSGATLICPGSERTSFRGAHLRGAYVHALAAQVCDFTDADLSNLLDATGSLFHGCKMVRTRLDGAVLGGACFYQCDLEGARLVAAKLQGAVFNECFLSCADLSLADVGELVVTKCNLRGANLSGVAGAGLVLQRLTGADDLVIEHARIPRARLLGFGAARVRARGLQAGGADLAGLHLPDAGFVSADLAGVRFDECHLDRADFSGARLDSGSLRRCSARNAVLRQASGENLQVLESDLEGADLGAFAGRCLFVRDANLAGANLASAYLYRSMLTGDPPRSMSLRGADLSGANLVQAYLAADLSGAVLRGAKGAYARLNQCDLSGADLTGASLFEASAVKVDFRGAALGAVDAPVFFDRCSGLREAIDAVTAPACAGARDRLRAYADDLERLLRQGRGGST